MRAASRDDVSSGTWGMAGTSPTLTHGLPDTAEVGVVMALMSW